MSSVAVVFAVLGTGATPVTLGYVMAAGIVPQIVFMLGGGVAADRFGRRRVMLAADVTRGCAQALLAAALLTGHPPLWVFITLQAALGTGEAFFTPALSGLTVDIASAARVPHANVLLGIAASAAKVAGPVLAGVLVVAVSPAAVIAFDAASYGVSVLALALLRFPARVPAPARARARARAAMLLGDLREGWGEFWSRPWLLATTVQFTLFNLITWGPFLLLGPVLAVRALGGAAAWGAIMGCYGAGSVIGGLLALGAAPRRPVAASTIATFGFALPPGLLAVGVPVAAVAAGALAAGAGSAVGAAFDTTATQQQVPAGALARVSALQMVTAFAFGPAAFAAAGPVAAAVGVRAVLGFGAAWALLGSAVVLALPSVRSVTWQPGPPGGRGGGAGDR